MIRFSKNCGSSPLAPPVRHVIHERAQTAKHLDVCPYAATCVPLSHRKLETRDDIPLEGCRQ